MKALKVVDGDIIFEEVSDTDEVVQRIKEAFGTNKGEWFLDPNEGFYYSVIRGKNISEEEVRAEIQSVADQIDEMDHAENIRLDFDRSKRKLAVFFTAVLTNGERVQIEEVL